MLEVMLTFEASLDTTAISFAINVLLEIENVLLSPALTALSNTSENFELFIITLLPDPSTPSLPIFLNSELVIVRLEKSESIASFIIFLNKEFLINNIFGSKEI